MQEFRRGTKTISLTLEAHEKMRRARRHPCEPPSVATEGALVYHSGTRRNIMSERAEGFTRRGALKAIGALGAASLGGAEAAGAAEEGRKETGTAVGFREDLAALVARTPIADTHEHLPDEDERLKGEKIACDDWSLLFSHYIDSDLVAAGMTGEDRDRLLARDGDPIKKWKILEPWWPAVKSTGYGRAVRIAMRDLYGINALDAAAVPHLQEAYESMRKPGLYRKVLVDTANIDHCQVNYLWEPFHESRDPLLLQDISIVGMHVGPSIEDFAGPLGKEVKDLADWHAVIDGWFDRYGKKAVAVKSQAAYMRGLDYERVPAEKAAPVFAKVLRKDPVSPEEKKLLEDHLFWHAVDAATRHRLPVKLHTGYYAGENGMPLGRVAANPAQAADLCRRSPATRFVFMHIAYPYWQDLVAVAKHYTNAYLDMCWSWIIDPVAAKGFLKSFLAAAPSNKVLTFGGDYIPVECVAGHARIARDGIARALVELVDEGILGRRDAMELVEPLLRGNARTLFGIGDKGRR
jgi:predicted TIM-barrel fold metal-dependent hydrolase